MDSPERPILISHESAQQVQALRQEVVAKSAQQIKADFLDAATRAAELRQVIKDTIRREPTKEVRLGDEASSTKNKAVTVKEAVQKILLTARVPGKLPTPGIAGPEQTRLTSSLIAQISDKLNPERVEISDTAAPYIYQILHGVIEGRITDVEGLAHEFNGIKIMEHIAPETYKALQQALVDLAKQSAYGNEAAENLFNVVRPENQRINPRTGELEKKPVRFEPEERKRLDDLSYQIHQSEKLTREEKDKLFEEMRSGRVGSTVEMQLAKVFGNDDEAKKKIDEIKGLVFKAAEYRAYMGGSMPGFEQYMPDGEKRKFTFEYLKENHYIGENGLTNEGKRELRKSALRAVNKLFAKADYQTGVEFEKSFSEFHEGYHFRDIQEIIVGLIDDPRLLELGGIHSEAYRETVHWLKEGVLNEIGREKELRALYHNVGIWIKMMQPKQLSEHMAAHNVSEATSVVMSDVSGKIVSLAMSEYERYIQFDIAKHKGKVRPNLFAGKVNPNELYYDEEDQSKMRERFMETVKGLIDYSDNFDASAQGRMKGHDITRYDIDNLRGLEDWEVDRALKYARGIHLTQTIRAYEVVASTRPREDFLGSANNFYDMAGNLNPSWRWELGRGHGGIRLRHVKEILVADTLVKRPKESLIARIFDRSFVPKGIHDKVESYSEYQMTKNWDRIKDTWLYRDMSFRQLINKFSATSGLYGRGGWRREGFKEEGGAFDQYVRGVQEVISRTIKERDINANMKFGDGNWEETYKAIGQVVGVGARFWFDGDRASEYTKGYLWKHLGIDPAKEPKSKLDRLWAEYTTGKKGGEIVMTAPNGEKLTVKDLMEIRVTILQGRNFADLLKRSPLDFLNNLINIQPDLMTEGLGGDRGKIFFECFGGDAENPRLVGEKELREILRKKGYSGKELADKAEQIMIFQRKLKRYWGEDNFKHIVYLRNFYQGLEDWAKQVKDKDGKMRFHKDGKFDKDMFFDYFYKKLDLAVEKVKLRKGSEMEAGDIEDKDLQEFFFGTVNGKPGLVTYFNNLNEDFGAMKDKKDVGLGERGFFYHMARSWYNELGTNIHPNTSDVDWRYILHNIGEATGETLVKRLWGDMAAWNEVMSGLMNLDHMLFEAANSHSLDKIIEFQHKMHAIEGISGKDAMYEAQYYFSQLVIRYFQQTPATRLPFPLSTVYSLFKGKELSLSRIYNGPAAMVLSTDGINAYLQKLQSSWIIPQEGQFGFERLSKAMGADWAKLNTEIVPDIAIMLSLFLLWKFINESLKEAEGRKK